MDYNDNPFYRNTEKRKYANLLKQKKAIARRCAQDGTTPTEMCASLARTVIEQSNVNEELQRDITDLQQRIRKLQYEKEVLQKKSDVRHEMIRTQESWIKKLEGELSELQTLAGTDNADSFDNVSGGILS